MDVKWVKIRSWHAVKEIRELPSNTGWVRTQCGRGDSIAGMRISDMLIVTELPTEKSCESCLRIVARLADA